MHDKHFETIPVNVCPNIHNTASILLNVYCPTLSTFGLPDITAHSRRWKEGRGRRDWDGREREGERGGMGGGEEGRGEEDKRRGGGRGEGPIFRTLRYRGGRPGRSHYV